MAAPRAPSSAQDAATRRPPEPAATAGLVSRQSKPSSDAGCGRTTSAADMVRSCQPWSIPDRDAAPTGPAAPTGAHATSATTDKRAAQAMGGLLSRRPSDVTRRSPRTGFLFHPTGQAPTPAAGGKAMAEPGRSSSDPHRDEGAHSVQLAGNRRSTTVMARSGDLYPAAAPVAS